MNSGSDRTKNTDTGGQSSGRSGVSSAASVIQEKWCIRYRCDTNISGLPALDRPRVARHAEILSRRDRSLSPRPFYQGWQASKRNENSFGKRLLAFLAVLQFFLLSLSLPSLFLFVSFFLLVSFFPSLLPRFSLVHDGISITRDDVRSDLYRDSSPRWNLAQNARFRRKFTLVGSRSFIKVFVARQYQK